LAATNTKFIDLSDFGPGKSCTTLHGHLVAETIRAQVSHRVNSSGTGTGDSSSIPSISISISWSATGGLMLSVYYRTLSEAKKACRAIERGA